MKDQEFNENRKSIQSPDEDQWIREALCDYPVWEVDSQSYVQQMMDALNSSKSQKWKKVFQADRPIWRLDWRWGMAMGLAIIAFVTVLWFPLDSKPVSSSIQWISFPSNQLVDAPISWKNQLDEGKAVSVPPNVKARIHLVDGSTLDCSPRTILAVKYQAIRRIDLSSGMIEVTAAHLPDKPMRVSTPFNTLEVIGTKFTVELLSESTGKENES